MKSMQLPSVVIFLWLIFTGPRGGAWPPCPPDPLLHSFCKGGLQDILFSKLNKQRIHLSQNYTIIFYIYNGHSGGSLIFLIHWVMALFTNVPIGWRLSHHVMHSSNEHISKSVKRWSIAQEMFAYSPAICSSVSFDCNKKRNLFRPVSGQ